MTGIESEIAPIPDDTSDWDAIEERIIKVFREEIYAPLIIALGLSKRRLIINTKNDLLNAIRRGQISFYRGRFTGKFDSKISRQLRNIGAKWSDGGYDILSSELPDDVMMQIRTSKAAFDKVIDGINDRLNRIIPKDVAARVDVSEAFDKTLWKTDKNIKRSLKNIIVQPLLTKKERQFISREYTHNLDRYIQDFTKKEVLKLRKQVQESALKGFRYESMVDFIQKSYDVSQNKAKFLARQETHLFLTTFKQKRYEEAGSKEYRWQCVAGTNAHPVRPMHKKLDGTIHKWSNPPVTSPDGRKNHPGADFGCRCVARPIVRF